MKHVFLDRRDGRLALYLNGDLQFDADDERRYHEPLALIPVALAARRARGRALRVLVLGGGDGLALREVLRFPEVAEAHLVDRDAEVLRLGAEELAGLNREAFRDPRLRVHVQDASEHVGRARGFDVVISDLTYPHDVSAAALFSTGFYRKLRATLRAPGVLAVNAVSPELTPEAFGCVGASLETAGFSAVPYAVTVPSFLREGYGRWGFFFASARPIGTAELSGLRFPDGVDLTASAVRAGTRLPVSARTVMRVAPNRTDELLYYLSNGTPLAWHGPAGPLRLAPASPGAGPRLTAAQGFARWLRAPAGRRSLDELLRCLPLPQRGQTRAALYEWSEQAEVLFREVDLRAFVDEALRRARALPPAWRRELTVLRDRIRDGLPSMRELLEHAYRVFAVYLIVLLLVNLFFPDNLYAKGFSSSSSSSRSWSSSAGSGSWSGFTGFNFSDPGRRATPYRYSGTSRSWARGYATVPPRQVYDSQGRDYPAQRLMFTDPAGGRKPVSALLALTRDLQLLESGALAYATGVAGLQGLLEPGRLRILDTSGRELLALLPAGGLEDEARAQVLAQGPLIDKAIADHRHWVEWVRWASFLPQGVEAVSELTQLEGIRKVVETARGVWARPSPRGAFRPEPGWDAIPVFPGIYLDWQRAARVGVVAGQWVVLTSQVYPEIPRSVHRAPMAVLVTPEGEARSRLLVPPAQLIPEDRALFQLVARHGRARPALSEAITRWAETHGEALRPASGPPPSPATPGARL